MKGNESLLKNKIKSGPTTRHQYEHGTTICLSFAWYTHKILKDGRKEKRVRQREWIDDFSSERGSRNRGRDRRKEKRKETEWYSIVLYEEGTAWKIGDSQPPLQEVLHRQPCLVNVHYAQSSPTKITKPTIFILFYYIHQNNNIINYIYLLHFSLLSCIQSKAILIFISFFILSIFPF